jgi:hypothetical protein
MLGSELRTGRIQEVLRRAREANAALRRQEALQKKRRRIS